jgi:hypothetical protein
MVIACLALVIALSGTSYAVVLALPVNSVGTTQLKANAFWPPSAATKSWREGRAS